MINNNFCHMKNIHPSWLTIFHKDFEEKYYNDLPELNFFLSLIALDIDTLEIDDVNLKKITNQKLRFNIKNNKLCLFYLFTFNHDEFDYFKVETIMSLEKVFNEFNSFYNLIRKNPIFYTDYNDQNIME